MTNLSERSQLLKKLLRWVFVSIIIISLLQIPLFITMRETGSMFDLGGSMMYYLLGATVIGVILVAIVLFAIGPIVIKLFDIRKKEKEEKEDPGMFV